MIYLIFLGQSIVFGIIFLLLYLDGKKNKQDSTDLIREVLSSFGYSTDKFYEMASKMQIKHFESLEKQSAKQLALLDKNSKAFLEAIKAMNKPSTLASETISPIDSYISGENTIEKEEIPEVSLDEDVRIPIVEGVKFQFEGEEEILEFNPE